MRERQINFAIAAVVVSAVVSTGVTVVREFFPPLPRAGGEPHLRIQADWTRYAAAGHVMGPNNAPVTIVEFADFQCPFCRMFKAYLDTLRRQHPNDVRLVFRNFPLPIHPFAASAARVSECAGEQGRFEAMYDALYTHQDSIGFAPWSWFARSAQVPDLVHFSACVQDTLPLATLAQDTLAGRQLGVQSTPTLLINNLRIDGVPPLDSLEVYVARAKAVAMAGP